MRRTIMGEPWHWRETVLLLAISLAMIPICLATAFLRWAAKLLRASLG